MIDYDDLLEGILNRMSDFGADFDEGIRIAIRCTVNSVLEFIQDGPDEDAADILQIWLDENA